MRVRILRAAGVGGVAGLVPGGEAVPGRAVGFAAEPAGVGVGVEDGDDVVEGDVEVGGHAALGRLVVADQEAAGEGAEGVAGPGVEVEGQGAGPGVSAVPWICVSE